MSKSATEATPAQEPAAQPAADTTTTPAPSAAEFRAKSHATLNGTRTLSLAQSDLEFALGAGAAIVERSTLGAMLERSQLYAFAGKHRKDPAPVPIPRRSDGQMVIKRTHDEPSVDVDLLTLARIGRGHKLLDLVWRVSPLARKVLVAYHGERGARWGREMRDDNSGGAGNRDLAIYPLTEMGVKWVAALRSKFPLSGALMADEVLANEYAMAKRKRDDIRTHRLSRCAIEARALIGYAHEILESAASFQIDSARRIRRANVAAGRGRETVPRQQRPGSRVILRTAGGAVMHGPFRDVDLSTWQDVEQRGCQAEVVA
jgi:hypothetical protein